MKVMKSMIAGALIFALVLTAFGCAPSTGGTNPSGTESPAESKQPVGSGNAEPTDNPNASSPSESKAPEVKVKPVLLVVSFGTSYNDSRDVTIGALEKALEEEFKDYEVRRAFTSQIIIDKLKERDKLSIDNVKEAMDRLVADGVKNVVIQPTHVMRGFEYDDVVKEANVYKNKFDSFRIGKPLLDSDADYEKVSAVLAEETSGDSKKDVAFVFMGHGTEHEANATYAHMQDVMKKAGHTNFFVGTVEATPSVQDVLKLVKDAGFKKVEMRPLMIVAGDHANNDMAGDEEDSWKSVFTAAGLEVECVIKGLGQYQGIQALLREHVAALIAD